MKTNLKIIATFLLASMVLLISPARLLAQAPAAPNPLWKVVKTELRNDDRQFVITLERSFLDSHQQNDLTIPKIFVAIRSDNNLITYLPSRGVLSSKITIDMNNKSEISSLSELIADFKKWDSIEKAIYLHDIDVPVKVLSEHKPPMKSFSGTIGSYDVDYEASQDESHASRNYGGSIRLTSKDGDDKKFKEIVEPTALEQVILSIDDFHKMQQEAIQAKAKQLTAQKTLQEEQAQDEIANAKAESNERVKIEVAKHQEQMAELEKKQKLQAIKDAEIVARHDKALAFLNSSEGKSMAEEITSLDKEVSELDNKERRADYGDLLEKRDALQKQMLDIHLDSYERQTALDQFGALQVDLAKASGNHKSSDRLKSKQSNLNLLLTEFEKKSGMPYNDTIALKVKAIK